MLRIEVRSIDDTQQEVVFQRDRSGPLDAVEAVALAQVMIEAAAEVLLVAEASGLKNGED